MATTQACKEAMRIQKLLKKLGPNKKTIYLLYDSLSTYIAKNPTSHSKTKYTGSPQFQYALEVVGEGSVGEKIYIKDKLAHVSNFRRPNHYIYTDEFK